MIYNIQQISLCYSPTSLQSSCYIGSILNISINSNFSDITIALTSLKLHFLNRCRAAKYFQFGNKIIVYQTKAFLSRTPSSLCPKPLSRIDRSLHTQKNSVPWILRSFQNVLYQRSVLAYFKLMTTFFFNGWNLTCRRLMTIGYVTLR